MLLAPCSCTAPSLQSAKLFGHANELVSLALAPSGQLFASACKSKLSLAQAAVRVWDVATLKLKAELQLHKSTVTALAFSPDSTLLASVSKGRSLYIVSLEPQPAVLAKGFIATRMLLSLAWAPLGGLLATGARDPKSPNARALFPLSVLNFLFSLPHPAS